MLISLLLAINPFVYKIQRGLQKNETRCVHERDIRPRTLLLYTFYTFHLLNEMKTFLLMLILLAFVGHLQACIRIVYPIASRVWTWCSGCVGAPPSERRASVLLPRCVC